MHDRSADNQIRAPALCPARGDPSPQPQHEESNGTSNQGAHRYEHHQHHQRYTECLHSAIGAHRDGHYQGCKRDERRWHYGTSDEPSPDSKH